MAVSFAVFLIVFLFLQLGAIICLIYAARLPIFVRALAVIQFSLVAMFCVFGFLASFEPGPDALVWRFAYGTLGLTCFGSLVRLLFTKSTRRQESNAK